jgi:hypothetical protein
LSWWSDWLPASCYPAACFCERIHDGLVRQPANTLSSLAFLIPAWLVLGTSAGSPRPPAAIRFSIALAMIGLGSAFFHASLTFVGQTFDLVGMYLLITVAVLSAAERLGLLNGARATRWYLGANGVLLVGLLVAPSLRRYLFAALALAAIGLEWRAGRERAGASGALTAAVATLGVGFATWALDITRVWCSAGSQLQGNAGWHLLTALAAWFYARHALGAGQART